MSILKLIPSCKNYIWGGNKLKTEFHKKYDGDMLAESWELSCHVDGQSLISEGAFQGKTLQEYIEWEGKKVLGLNCKKYKSFPVLIKFIDAKENLSIQVHPSDEYALKNEGQYGKTEMWYVVDCAEDAYLYYGFQKSIDKDEFRQRIQNNTLLEVLNEVPVKKGDVFFIEAGTIHAIGKNIVIAEIQENSNVTYRVYDYGRVDKNGKYRDLHIEKALEVTNTDSKHPMQSFAPHIAVSNYFVVDKISLDGMITNEITGEVNADSFLHILIIEGNGTIQNKEIISFEKGDSILLTASTGKFTIKGKCEALLTTIPNRKE